MMPARRSAVAFSAHHVRLGVVAIALVLLSIRVDVQVLEERPLVLLYPRAVRLRAHPTTHDDVVRRCQQRSTQRSTQRLQVLHAARHRRHEEEGVPYLDWLARPRVDGCSHTLRNSPVPPRPR